MPSPAGSTYLDQEQQVHVFGLGRSPLGPVPAPVVDVDTLGDRTNEVECTQDGRGVGSERMKMILTMFSALNVQVISAPRTRRRSRDEREGRAAYANGGRRTRGRSVATRPRAAFLRRAAIFCFFFPPAPNEPSNGVLSGIFFSAVFHLTVTVLQARIQKGGGAQGTRTLPLGRG